MTLERSTTGGEPHEPSQSAGGGTTGRNPDVLYELGLAHALHKPVVLISSNEADVPFDVRHVRVIYYELTDPFWGEKLIAKVAENIISAVKNPQEAIQFPQA